MGALYSPREMEMVCLRPDVWVLRGGVNLGVILAEGEAVFVDAGLDEGSARRLWRWAEEQGLRPRAAILTHAHADHFGGAHVWEARGLPLFAPAFEAAMMQHPLLEPIFLFSGASPPPELLGKFTLARPLSAVSHLEPGAQAFGPVSLACMPLPGHSPAQVGVAVGNILFCADAIFTPDVLRKHPIPFCYDLGQALASAQAVEEYEVLVPGHGAPLEGPAAKEAAQAYRAHLLRLVEEAENALGSPLTAEELLRVLAHNLGLPNLNLVGFLLARTTVFAVLAFLVREGRAEPLLEGGFLRWRRR